MFLLYFFCGTFNMYFQRWASNLSVSNGKSSSALNLNKEVMMPAGAVMAGAAMVVGFWSALYSDSF